MKPSGELRNAVLKWYESESSGDVKAFENLFSHQPGILFIGTDPEEWWSEYAAIQWVFIAQLQELGPKIKIISGDLHALVEDTVGWAADSANYNYRMVKKSQFVQPWSFIVKMESGKWFSIMPRLEHAMRMSLAQISP